MGPTPIGVDARGNRWLSAPLSPSHLHLLAGAHAQWSTASDKEISDAKAIIAAAAGLSGEASDSLRGMACADFLYLYNGMHQHLFVHLEAQAPAVLIYEGECDMYWSPFASFDIIQMQVDMALEPAAVNPFALPDMVVG
jgi:hypothetical protein